MTDVGGGGWEGRHEAAVNAVAIMRATVILTKVRIQSHEGRQPSLWILTFVRMTEWTIRGIPRATAENRPLKQQ
ncbi:hypothetical protein C8J47_0394 [Sphingomonas sp. PP-F2F-G114-C0414]|nr:hypothetical protein C8J47_0394 [Sphingomonas sp. PP-F2F-G114-C0414]